MNLSERQVRMLEFIRAYLREHSYPPTIREIGKAVGIPSTSVVKYNLERLQEKGFIERSGEVSRGLKLKDGPSFGGTGNGQGLVSIRMLGVIHAGASTPTFGEEEDPYAGEMLTLTVDMVRDPKDVYALQVVGDSMIDALVNEGDWVVIKHQRTAQPRDMIVARILDKEETTLKYYYPEGERVRLQPANPKYDPIYVPAEQLEIQGKVVAVVRQLQ
ncbi:MAG: transcriptional repressor LexA [Anaerolineae bacterium]|nr:transcriptional repressor LexA [Anaerolineae bacterium]